MKYSIKLLRIHKKPLATIFNLPGFLREAGINHELMK